MIQIGILDGRVVILARNFENHVSDKEDNKGNRVLVGREVEIYLHARDLRISDTVHKLLLYTKGGTLVSMYHTYLVLSR